MKKYVGPGVVAALLLIPLAMRLVSSDHGVAVDLGAVDRHTIQATILASGTVGYDSQVSLSPEVIGRVTAVFVKEGDTVQAGQPLLTIDDKTLRAQLAESEAQLRVQRLTIEQQEANLIVHNRKLYRIKELLDRGFAPQASYDDQGFSQKAADVQLRLSRENYRQASAVLQQTRERLNKTVIRAPMSGTVIAISIKTGETAVPSAIGIAGSSLVTIADTGTLMAELNVDEADVASIGAGQQVQLHILAYPDQTVYGTIVRVPISPKQATGALLSTSDSQGRTYIVKTGIRIDPGILLRPGMSCRGEIATETHKAVLTVPVQAVLRPDSEGIKSGQRKVKDDDDPQSYVFVAANGKAVRRVVRIGLSNDLRQEVTSGLRAGEHIVIGPTKELRVLRDGDIISTRATKMP